MSTWPPKALVTPTGETYAMVAATITKDNFILVFSPADESRRFGMAPDTVCGPNDRGRRRHPLVRRILALDYGVISYSVN
ncbi:MAG: hypothetical protein WD425_05780 [Nitrospirales bacterium]